MSLLFWGINQLQNAKVINPQKESELLLSSILNIPCIELYQNKNQTCAPEHITEFKEKIKKRATRYPLVYILKTVDFYDVSLYVDERVLIPRPETELLCEKILDILGENEEKINILDVCTGSGAIAAVLAKHLKNATVFATDISEEALQVAKINTQNLDNVFLMRSDLLSAVRDEKFDVIVSNPPYVLTKEMQDLSEDVLFEPAIALDGGEDGLKFYRKIMQQARDCLKDEGTIFFEIHEDKGEDLRALAGELGFMGVEVLRDYNERDRFLILWTK